MVRERSRERVSWRRPRSGDVPGRRVTWASLAPLCWYGGWRLAVTHSLHEMRRIPRLAVAGIVAAGSLCGCSPSSAGQPAVTYARYTFACCTASDIERVWHPGEIVSLHWIVVAAGATADSRPRPITLTAVLAGPFASVDGLKGGAAARAAELNTDDRNPTAPTSTFALPSNLAPGFYNLAFKVDYGGGNSVAGASVVRVGATANGTLSGL